MLKIKKLRPVTCNICGGKVEFIQNKLIYGKPFGSGYCYYCKNCGAYVGTHKVRPREAMGILANEEMRQMKMKCHGIFDGMWQNGEQRRSMYKWLAGKLGIAVEECHFGYFDMDMLNKAYEILLARKAVRNDGL